MISALYIFAPHLKAFLSSNRGAKIYKAEIMTGYFSFLNLIRCTCKLKGYFFLQSFRVSVYDFPLERRLVRGHIIMTLNKNILLLFILFFSVIGLSGCYQIHSDDDLRTVPVTNNPNIVPQMNGRVPGVGI